IEVNGCDRVSDREWEGNFVRCVDNTAAVRSVTRGQSEGGHACSLRDTLPMRSRRGSPIINKLQFIPSLASSGVDPTATASLVCDRSHGLPRPRRSGIVQESLTVLPEFRDDSVVPGGIERGHVEDSGGSVRECGGCGGCGAPRQEVTLHGYHGKETLIFKNSIFSPALPMQACVSLKSTGIQFKETPQCP
ncbi:hypothetical protein J6590_067912, partial [Homalodisca vitripennis]